MRASTSVLVTAIVSLMWLQSAAAAEIYRWVDADGVVHYSDTAPRKDVPVTTVEIEAKRPSNYDPLTDPYSILNQARRIGETHSALVQARTEREQSLQKEPTYAPQNPYWLPPQYGRWWLPGQAPPRYPAVRPHAAMRQFNAMEQLELTGPRPPSINSGAHRQRVERSAALPVTPVHRPQ